jgi:hypothetical protein
MTGRGVPVGRVASGVWVLATEGESRRERRRARLAALLVICVGWYRTVAEDNLKGGYGSKDYRCRRCMEMSIFFASERRWLSSKHYVASLFCCKRATEILQKLLLTSAKASVNS